MNSLDRSSKTIPAKMMFRANTSLVPWILVGCVSVYAFDVFRNRNLYAFWRVSGGAVVIASIAMFILSHFSNYWELSGSGLRQRKFWKTKEISWEEVTRISRLGFSGKYVKISYGRDPETCAYIVAEPSNLGGFIAALRQFIPANEFDELPSQDSKCGPRRGGGAKTNK